MKLNAILVEDEEKSREILRNYLNKYCPNVSIIGEASNVEEALVLIRNNDLDVVFLDVEMPYGNAFDLLDKVGNIDFETIEFNVIQIGYLFCFLLFSVLGYVGSLVISLFFFSVLFYGYFLRKEMY